MVTFGGLYPQVFGKYILERELSRGGMARVILATLRGAGGFEKKLVVKQIRDELAFDHVFIHRFVEEAKTTVALSHPNIVPVYELGVEQGTYFLAMELVEGVSVADLLRQRNPDGSRRVLTPEEGAYLGMEVCRALDYAHRRMKVVHRDITPRNVMIDEEGQIKLIDFGIAAPALVAGHEILGSPGHMAPEQVDGGELGPPTDIFAVAVLLMEAWTGSAPFRRATPEECAAAVREPHPKPSDFSARLVPLDAAIARAMAVDARERQQEASDLARSLRAFLQEVDIGDVARTLGDRVRDLREKGAAPAPPSERNAPRPSAASHGDLGTKTFAAREEALRWSRPPPDEIESQGPVPSTRKLAEPTPVSPKVEDTGLPTPLMVDVEELERIHAEIAKNTEPEPESPRQADIPTMRRARLVRPSDAAPHSDILPLETPVQAGPRGGRFLPVVLALAIVAVGAVAVWRLGRPEPRTSTQPTATASTPTHEEPRAPAPPVSAPETAPTAVRSAPKAPVSVVVSPAAAAKVTLLGDPGTRVSVDGAARGPCPVKLSLEPGTHDVRFQFDATGESRGERLVVKSGEQVTVRAEFTGATPTIKILR